MVSELIPRHIDNTPETEHAENKPSTGTTQRKPPAVNWRTFYFSRFLENAFYNEGLAKFDAKAFEAAGYGQFVRGRYEQIAAHEKTHVAFLSTALGDKATKPCQYKL